MGSIPTTPYNSPKGGPAWPSSLHTVHRSSSYMNTDCDLCHTSGDGRDPFIGSSNGTGSTVGLGCVGCHGRDYGGGTGVSGVGLRAHHAVAGVGSCAGCHGGDPAPLDESVLPEHCGSPDTNADFSCNDDAGTSEDWSGDGVGLDNDGDDLYDTSDPDCSVGPFCGDGNTDPGETCDPPATCPTTCDDGNTCTLDTLNGSAASCDAACQYDPIVVCVDADGCCAPGCTANNDDDCAPQCGNSVVEPGETCDPPGTCPTDCDDGEACTMDSMTGSSVNCNAACSNVEIVSCADDDGCCPAGCDDTVDTDCATTPTGTAKRPAAGAAPEGRLTHPCSG